MKYTFFVPERIHKDALDYLAEEANLLLGFGEGGVSYDEGYSKSDAVILRAAVKFTSYDIDKAPKLKIISRHGVGVENIDVEYATSKNIQVLNTQGANTESVAEHALGMMIAISKRIVENDNITRKGNFIKRDKLLGTELFGKKLGVIGYGRIGAEVSRKCKTALSMDIIAYDPFIEEEILERAGIKKAYGLDEIFVDSDYVAVFVPLNKYTENLISEREFTMMKNSSFLIHMSRGGVVNENALIKALNDGEIRGAAVDVFKTEPPEIDHGFFNLENIIVTPHTAAHTEEAFRKMAMWSAKGALEMLNGNEITFASMVNNVKK